MLKVSLVILYRRFDHFDILGILNAQMSFREFTLHCGHA